jgi:hypothetical protein
VVRRFFYDYAQEELVLPEGWRPVCADGRSLFAVKDA